MPLLFSLTQPLTKLKERLLVDYAGQTRSFAEIYEKHSVDTPYIERNYREALNALEAAGHISAYSTTTKRRKGTYPDHIKIEFTGME